MLDFGERTKFGKAIPKEKFYAKLTMGTRLRDCFVHEVQKIVWANKLSDETVNIERGEKVGEIEVIEIYLKNGELSDSVLEVISKQIPHRIVFVVRYEGRVQLCVYLARLHKTVWQAEEAAVLRLDGADLDKVWDNIVMQISGIRRALPTVTAEEAVRSEIEREKLQKRIDALELRMHREVQFNKKVKLKKEIKELRARIEEIG